MAAPVTIIDLKKTFLSAQIRVLNTPLQPARDWQEELPASDEGDISARVVDDVLSKLNTIARHHNVSAYSNQTVRHVAEQIDALYWDAADRGTILSGEEVFEKGVDLRKEGNIAKLPKQWYNDDGVSEDDMKGYASLQASLTALSARRQAARQKLAQYRQFQELLAPFQSPQEKIQPNLVTRDGELGRELDRLRVLSAIVSERIAGLKGATEAREDAEEAPESEHTKLQELLQKR